MTDCTKSVALVEGYAKPVVTTFDAPHTSSDGGALLLRGVDRRLGICKALGALVPDARTPERVVHSREEQFRQRVLQIALGYEDCNDAATLRLDPALRLGCTGGLGAMLSSQPSLSRFENAVNAKAIARMTHWFEDSWVRSLAADTTQVVLDIDSTADPTHGQQQLSFFHGFYDQHMYHPLLVFDGQGQLITALLRSGRAHAAQGAVGPLRRVIGKVKKRFPQAQVLVRGDSAFAGPRITTLLDDLNGKYGGVDFVFGLARNPVLERALQPLVDQAKEQHLASGKTIQLFTDFAYKADSWVAPRRVIGKAEYSDKGKNPRFVVTSLYGDAAEDLYRWYCGRGQVENDIKDLKLGLAADRLSCSSFLANWFRLLEHAAAYRLMYALRRQAGEHSEELAVAQFDTLRLRLLKVAALVSASVRRVLVRLPVSFPLAEVFAGVLRDLQPDTA